MTLCICVAPKLETIICMDVPLLPDDFISLLLRAARAKPTNNNVMYVPYFLFAFAAHVPTCFIAS